MSVMLVSQKQGDATYVWYDIALWANLIIKQINLKTAATNFVCFGANLTCLCTAHCFGLFVHCYNLRMLI